MSTLNTTISSQSWTKLVDTADTDFLLALTDEVAESLVKQVVQDAGNPTLLFTNAQLERRLIDAIEGKKAQAVFMSAADRIIESVKRETNKVM